MQKEIIQHYIQAYNTFDVSGMIKDLDSSIIFENHSNGEVTHRTEGLESFRQQAEAAKDYFSSREQIPQNWVFEGATVTVEIQYRAILAVDLPNGLKAGENLQLKGTSIFTFHNDRIIKIQDKS